MCGCIVIKKLDNHKIQTHTTTTTTRTQGHDAGLYQLIVTNTYGLRRPGVGGWGEQLAGKAL